MSVHNLEIAALLNQLADLLDIEGDNVFRVRAYRNAARTIEGMSRGIAEMVAGGEDLSALPGIGAALSKKLAEIVTTGHFHALERETAHLPPGLLDLLQIPGLGPKRVGQLYRELKVCGLPELETALAEGTVTKLHGFGDKTVERIRDWLQRRQQAGPARLRRDIAAALTTDLLRALRALPGTQSVTPAGSFRRGAETVGDMDILATGDEPALVKCFVNHEDVAEILAQGDTRAAVRLRAGLQVDLRVVPPESYGAALHYFTGSKAHNIAIRTRGVKAGIKINEYGIFRGDARLGGAAEGEIFAAVGLPFIEPELREDRGEIAAAETGRLPKLLALNDLRGDLHAHTTESDGTASLDAMARAALAKNYAYLAITDHSRRMTVAHGLDAIRLRRQIAAIRAWNEAHAGGAFQLLAGSEVDILEDGALDLPDDVLAELDLVVASIHDHFGLDGERQTARMIKAMENPHVHIIGHPTGRLIGEREPQVLDMERLLAGARLHGVAMELSAQPSRLDLNDLQCRMAKERGVAIAISTDAHAPGDLALMSGGILQARRGWLEAADVLNTRPWPELRARLRRKAQ